MLRYDDSLLVPGMFVVVGTGPGCEANGAVLRVIDGLTSVSTVWEPTAAVPLRAWRYDGG